ncbi:MAG: hypothetical protein BWK79_05535, partial [Beggiatoa sp. IS2]
MECLQGFFIFTGFAILITYHAFLLWLLRRNPFSTSIGRTRHLLALWTEMIMTTAQKDILAVQTLRNWTMAASFLASTAIVIGLGILNLAITSEGHSKTSQLLNLTETINEELWLIKLILLSLNFFFAFFNFALAVRSYNHASFMLNVSLSKHLASETEALQFVVSTLKRGANHYTLGMRAYYLAIPLSLWLFGSLWFCCGA